MEHTTITIGRQFGSRGREIAKQLAKALNYHYYDKELLVKVAQKSGLTTEFLENTDERQTSPFFYSLLTSPSGLWWNDQYISTEALAHQAQIDTIHNLAQQEDCVIVGRCADYILKEKKQLLRIFICADLQDRIQHIMERDQLSEKEARKKIKEMEKSRSAYYNFNTDQKWADPTNYDLCINISKLGVQKTVDLIIETLHQITTSQ